MTLAAESEIGEMYINTCKAVPQRISLIKMGHPQPRTPMQTNNLDLHSVVTNNIHPRITKSLDMRVHCLRCQDTKGHVRYYWRPGKQNLADYWKKPHPESHHRAKRYKQFTHTCKLELLQGTKARTENIV